MAQEERRSSLFAQLIPLIDAALAISRDKELMNILTRIANGAEPIDGSSCSGREQEVLDTLSSYSKQECDVLSETFSARVKL
ncbi:hypothetical protein SCHPADRAFT_450172 [Schizopora paradoxa]|uniref:Uncharacterized protein n=1 Tax=Schizopora paradoxa TaxID=27342 RepID=A0A0H2S4S4_9AGAM|nr:hypothetical protein SCHPADRAFT_450172 [Schizopora paradoxa]